MRRLLPILLATAPLAGCQYLSAGEDIAIIDPFEGADETIAAAGDSVTQALNGEETEKSILIEVAPEVPPAVTADLIKSTDPEARTRQVSRSRIDPFAVLPIPLAPDPVVVPETPRAAGSGSSQRRGTTTATATTTTATPTTTAARPPVPTEPTPPPVRVQPPNEPLVQPSPIVALPRIPQPVVAPTISVSGVIQLGGEPYAIVSSSNEPERYVRVGDRLAGGSVRVKRIDTLAFEPQVILEENGIEVSRPVESGSAAAGEAAPVEEESPAESAAVPVATLPVSPTVAPIPLPPAATRLLNTPALDATESETSSQLVVPGFVPNSLLLQPPELTSQVTLPTMQIATPEVG